MNDKIALVTIHAERNNLAFPLAAAQLKSALPSPLRDITDLINFALDDDPQAMADFLLKEKYGRVAFSCYIWNADSVNRTALILAKSNREILLIAGGPQVTAASECLDNRLFDYLILNEGEMVLEKALTGKKEDPAVIIDGGQVNLETLPSPFLAGQIDPAGYPGILWELSRGCPFHCAFCYESRNKGWVRRFPMARLEEELNLFIEKGVTDIWVLDSTFNHDKAWCQEFLEMLADRAPHIHFTFEIRAEGLTRKQAELFGQLTASLQIGLQSSSKKVMAGLNRSFDPRKFKEKIKLLEENFLVYGFDLIYGLPGDTLDGFRESLNFALSLSPSNLDIFPLSLLPGTVLSEKAESLGLSHDGTTQRLINKHPDFSEADLNRAARLTRLCDLFYTKGLASMWFSTACRALELSPSVFLERFGIWMDQEGHDLEEALNHDPAPFQRGFLRHSFTWRSKEELYQPLNSFILWHEALNRLMEGEDEVIVELTHDPEALTQLELVGLENFNDFFPSHRQNWRIYSEENGIYWEPSP